MKWAVIGYGFIGRRHVESLRGVEGWSVPAVCDTSEDRRKEVRALHPETETYSTHEELLAQADIDAVVISVPNRFHKEVAIAAARAGKDIVLEKPAAMTVAEFDEIMTEVEAAGVRLTVHQQRRFDKDFQTAKTVYESGAIGEVYTIQSSLYGYNGNMHDWHVYAAEGGGMLYDWGVHLIDQALFMVDERLSTVYAELRNVINKEVDDYFKILLRFESGLVVELELGTYFLSAKPDWFNRHWFLGGSTGTMEATKFEPEGQIVRTTELLENVAGDQDKSAASYGPTRSFGVPRPGLIVTEPLPEVTTEQSDYFVNLKSAWDGDGDPILVTPAQVRRVLAVMEAVRESGRTGRTVAFES